VDGGTVQILEVGATIPWHACALGQAIVAYLPAPEQSRALATDLIPLTGQTKTSRAALNRVLDQVRRHGYAVEDQEATVGDAGIAAPIFGRDAVVAGAVGVVGAADRLLTPASRPDLTRAVQEAARAISRDLGAGRGDPSGPRLTALS
jgi:DNA-binding IclR family transcriptional regulator